jgi:hypothetical protein
MTVTRSKGWSTSCSPQPPLLRISYRRRSATPNYVDGGRCCNNPAFRAVAQLSRERVELPRIYVLSVSTGAVPITKAGSKFLRLHKIGWIRPAIDLAMSGSSDLANEDGSLVGYHCRVADRFESQIALDDYERAVAILPPLAEGTAKDVQDGVRRWLDGPPKTGLNFAGTWETTFAWGAARHRHAARGPMRGFRARRDCAIR